MEGIDLRQRLFFFVVFAILILLTLTLLRPFLTVIIVSLISVIMLKPIYSLFQPTDERSKGYESDYDEVMAFLKDMEVKRCLPTPYNLKIRFYEPIRDRFMKSSGKD